MERGAGGTFDAEKAGGATTLKQSDSFICLSLFGSYDCNCQNERNIKEYAYFRLANIS